MLLRPHRAPSEPRPNFIGWVVADHNPDRKLDLSAHKRSEHHSIQSPKCADWEWTWWEEDIMLSVESQSVCRCIVCASACLSSECASVFVCVFFFPFCFFLKTPCEWVSEHFGPSAVFQNGNSVSMRCPLFSLAQASWRWWWINSFCSIGFPAISSARPWSNRLH